MMKNQKIRVLVLGDEGVGKTTWITSLVSSSSDKLDKVTGPIVLPPELCVQSFDMSTVLIDTSSNPAHKEQVDEEIKDANVILLFYDVTNSETIKRLKDYWITRINSISNKIPIIIVGNKIDQFDDIRINESIEQNKVHKVIIPLIKQKLNQVEMGLECSATVQPNIKDIIYCAQRAVLFPLAPLYDISQKQLTVEFKRALTRIFRICDKNLDGIWSDQELIDFQLEVFRGELTKSDIKAIKEIIKEEVSKDSQEKGITLQGFLTLQKRCVELIKIQICWTILRHYGYNDKLELYGELFKDELIFDKDSGQSIELEDGTVEFLKNQFTRFQKNRLLSIQSFEEIFYPINRIPWMNIEKLVEIKQDENDQNKQFINLDSWLGLWNYLSMQDYKETFKFLKYIGHQASLQETFTITNKKNCYSQIIKMHYRNVFHICLIGPSKVGKTQILESLIKSQFNPEHVPSNQNRSVIKTFQSSFNGKKRTFIVTEVHEGDLLEFFGAENSFGSGIPNIQNSNNSNNINNNNSKFLINNTHLMKNTRDIDFIGLVYDDEQKVQQFLEQNENSIPQYIPRFFVKSKSDTDPNQGQDNTINISPALRVFSNQICEVSAKDKNVQSLFVSTVENLIENPTRGLSHEIKEFLKSNDNFFTRKGNVIFIGVVTTAVVGMMYYFSKKSPSGGGFKNIFGNLFRKK